MLAQTGIETLSMAKEFTILISIFFNLVSITLKVLFKGCIPKLSTLKLEAIHRGSWNLQFLQGTLLLYIFVHLVFLQVCTCAELIWKVPNFGSFVLASKSLRVQESWHLQFIFTCPKDTSNKLWKRIEYVTTKKYNMFNCEHTFIINITTTTMFTLTWYQNPIHGS